MENEPKITVKLRPQQLDDIIQALVDAAECRREDAALLHQMERVDLEAVYALVEEHDRYLQLVYWLQHVKEEGLDEIQQHWLSKRAGTAQERHRRAAGL